MEKDRKALLPVAGLYAALFALCLFVNWLWRYVLPPMNIWLSTFAVLAGDALEMLPAVLWFRNEKMTAQEIGFSREKPVLQVLIGIALGLLLSAVFVLLPGLFGQQMMQGSARTLSDVVVQILAFVAGTGLSEEFVYRGVLFAALRRAQLPIWAVVVVTSLGFGLLHISGGSLFQMGFAAVFGALLCLARENVPHCSLFSLILAHGTYWIFGQAFVRLLFG